MKESPNWLEMPDELMANILQRLDTVDILKNAGQVCTTWRRFCKDPAMWKVMYIQTLLAFNTNYNLEMLTKQTVNLSCGELIDVSIGDFCTDDLLHHIALHSSKVKRLCLWYCGHITGSGLSRAVKRLSQLEELEFSYIYIKAEDIEVIGRNCPQLKSLKIFDILYTGPYVECDDQAVAIANNMPELRHLQIYGDEMTNTGLEAILNGCPHLESLDINIRCCFNLEENLVKKCMERITAFTHNANQNSDDDSDDMYMYFTGFDVDESSEADD